MLAPDETIRGRTVIAADGQLVGEVSALLIETDEWRVESLQIALRKDIADQLGAHRGIFRAGTLEIPVRIIQSVGRTIILSVPVDGLRPVLPTDPETDPKPALG
ncbi:MAG: PRC-barrel domain-containing protein [Myxococcales bacterium]|nr:PRC-barrel domain-containing protein [Myxococcales bacterium]